MPSHINCSEDCLMVYDDGLIKKLNVKMFNIKTETFIIGK